MVHFTESLVFVIAVVIPYAQVVSYLVLSLILHSWYSAKCRTNVGHSNLGYMLIYSYMFSETICICSVIETHPQHLHLYHQNN